METIRGGINKYGNQASGRNKNYEEEDKFEWQ
jgi:hypothetical protein